MPATLEAPPPPPKKPEHKDDRLEIRLDPALAKRAKAKAKAHGWTLGAVVRALIALWTDENVISSLEVGEQSAPAPKRPRKPKPAPPPPPAPKPAPTKPTTKKRATK